MFDKLFCDTVGNLCILLSLLNYYCFGFCLTSWFLHNLLHIRLGPFTGVLKNTFRDYWCKIVYKLDALPVIQPTVSKH